MITITITTGYNYIWRDGQADLAWVAKTWVPTRLSCRAIMLT